MLSGNQVKSINALKLKKYREIRQQFIAEGSKLVLELLASDYEVNEVYATMEWITANRTSLLRKHVVPQPVSEKELSRITALSAPAPVIAVAGIPVFPIDPVTLSGKLILALDDIRDPGNLGTIIRIADWFGIDSVICSETTVDLYNPKVVQATMGSFMRTRVYYTNLSGFLSLLPASFRIYGAFLDGENIYATELTDKGVIIIGNESKGISGSIERFVTNRIYIPPFTKSREPGIHAESLNASVATAIICSEFRRRK